jgi:hypothetical protein
MPDRRKHRGKHPEDDRLFAESCCTDLRAAVADHSWLLTRGYAPDASLKLVGDRFDLTARQRLAIMRSSCSDSALDRRSANRIPLSTCTGRPSGVDGYNLLITVESALSGGLVVVGRDGCYRDLASIHGTYRKVDETRPAVELIVNGLRLADVGRVDWFLDRPVSNSGRLKTLIAKVVEECGLSANANGDWNIELVDSPDKTLIAYPGVVASADSALLDARPAGRWVNLAGELIDAYTPQAWVVDLRSPISRS